MKELIGKDTGDAQRRERSRSLAGKRVGTVRPADSGHIGPQAYPIVWYGHREPRVVYFVIKPPASGCWTARAGFFSLMACCGHSITASV